jgi:hypothetical protein
MFEFRQAVVVQKTAQELLNRPKLKKLQEG